MKRANDIRPPGYSKWRCIRNRKFLMNTATSPYLYRFKSQGPNVYFMDNNPYSNRRYYPEHRMPEKHDNKMGNGLSLLPNPMYFYDHTPPLPPELMRGVLPPIPSQHFHNTDVNGTCPIQRPIWRHGTSREDQRGGECSNSHRQLFTPRSDTPNVIENHIKHSPSNVTSDAETKKSNDIEQDNCPQPKEDVPDIVDANVLESEDNFVQVNRTSERKPAFTYRIRKKDFKKEDALRVIAVEKEFNRMQNTTKLFLRFPDPELNKDIVKQYSSTIESVHFQQPSTPRCCFVQLKDNADVEKFKDDISQITFGMGKIVVEEKNANKKTEIFAVNPEDIDPYTLYVGNLPIYIYGFMLRKYFPTSLRIDFGSQRKRNTRHAFVHYNSAEDAIEAYKGSYNLVINGRNVVVRFRRENTYFNHMGKTKIQNQSNKQHFPKATDKSDDVSNSLSNSNNQSSPDDYNSEIIQNKTNEPIDVKVNVGEKNDRLMRSKGFIPPETNFIKSEVETDGGTEPDHDNRYGKESMEKDLLGTKLMYGLSDYDEDIVKEEKYYDNLEDDEYIELSPAYRDNDKEEDDEDAFIYGPQHWERLRQRELRKKEKKPDVSLLSPFRMRALKMLPSILDDDGDDDLDKLFKNMNPEGDDDDSDNSDF